LRQSLPDGIHRFRSARRFARPRRGKSAESGYDDAQIYDPTETSVAGIHAFFLLLGEPEAYGLPPKPEIPTIYLRSAWTAAAATALGAIVAVGIVFAFFT
jgi:formate dehydrogenase iron-sulfur subunit